ncbi:MULTISPECIES: ABC transporter permease [Arthrospira]|uniref:FtsX-like permease family protein n=1 Tax=Limnospira platensis NIES-46 TaxID=1236695 RepID=A0A5M3T8E7_LIMPL|nr:MULTISPECIES: ABC transporter permease [Arthrospira]AMW30303.1 ABC transporter permease [Arthrospira platensis YZ]KDR58294.1 ABC transporter permease [Arthrospira platensis str. Paraca]MBD2669286.1 ABC transporter permease [Arthrospira platensis FACHB-439]MBD2711597.1 ABC transporter permease [Arthrospira platensis FACHB-835]MDT9311884.1 ABC transporter permease [Limnospira sp. Paracas R14]QQW28257.1 ABC transporter permease [Arthrospira sp. PCC 9108]
MASIARKNLIEDIPRFLAAQAGIMFAVSLVTIQNGILNGFVQSSSLLIDKSSADIWITSEDMVHLNLTMPLALEQLTKAQKVPGVELAEPLIFQSARWRDPTGQIQAINLVGSNPDGKLFAPWNIIEGDLESLKQPYRVIVDESNLNSLQVSGVGDTVTISGLEAKIVGLTQGTQPIVNSIFVFASLKNANAYVTVPLQTQTRCTFENGNLNCVNVFDDSGDRQTQTDISPEPRPLTLTDPITYILVKAKPNQDLQQLQAELEATLPNTRAYTRQEIAEKIQDYWQKRTGVGFVLSLGAVVGILVGMIVVAQILYASVADHIKEFGTLKAMGAPDRLLYSVILEQAFWMAVLGYIPGMALCLGVASWASATQGILILITPASAVGVFFLTLVMCGGSAFFAIQKVTRVDPAIVFKA